MQSPLRSFGSKAIVSSRLIRQMPAHSTFVEAFAGSAAVLLAKPPVKNEILNDADPRVFQFWSTVQRKGHHLASFLASKPFGNDDWDPGNDVERAALFCVERLLNFNGKSGRSLGNKKGVWESLPERIRLASRRCQRVQILNEDAATLISSLNDRGTLFYLDPPYENHDHDYQIKICRNALRSAMMESQGLFLVSEENPRAYGDATWFRSTVTFRRGIGDATEFCIANFRIPNVV